LRPKPEDPRGYMWDDKSQDPYDPDWWKKSATTTGAFLPPTDAQVSEAINGSGLFDEFDGNAAVSPPYTKAYQIATKNGELLVTYWLFVPIYDRGAPAGPSEVVDYSDYVGCYHFTWQLKAGQAATTAEVGGFATWDVRHSLEEALGDIDRQIQETLATEKLSPGWPTLDSTGKVTH